VVSQVTGFATENTMDYQQTIDDMSPEIYQRLVRAVEIGKWPDNKPLTSEQRVHAMRAIIAWGERHCRRSSASGISTSKKRRVSCAMRHWKRR
jgi:uncharacterized protein YeaC (DUF1315 family)